MRSSGRDSVDRRAWGIVAAAAPLHVLLALSTDLSPDEAYYLCAARSTGVLPPLVDHPPLLPWLFRAVDKLDFLPVELRIRLVPIVCSLGLGLLCVELARRRGADAVGRSFAAWIAGFAILPMIAGFVATPDGPALLAIAAGLLWASPNGIASGGASLADHAEERSGGDMQRSALALSVGAALALGALAKVVVIPVALLLAVLAKDRPARERLAVIAPLFLVAPLLLPSLRFQVDHAFIGKPHPWSAAAAAGALAEAILVQALLWSPGVLVWGVAAARRLPRPDQGLLASISILVGLSALLRATPPEANWWAPAALVVLIGAAADAGRRSRRARAVVLATVMLPTAIALSHAIRPFLPLPAPADPTARLHGWSRGAEPLDAAGVGPYGPAAERCVYQHKCDEIHKYFENINVKTSSDL